MSNKIKIIALFGQAGSGKDYLFNKIVQYDEDGVLEPMFNKIVKATTRPKRENEEEGIHYWFMSPEVFAARRAENYISGVSEYRGWYYGIDIGSIAEDKPNLVILDIQQIRDLLTRDNVDLTLFQITASPKTRMLRQLNRETSPDVDEINRRYNADKKEYDTIDFDYIELPNETFSDASSAILQILRVGAELGNLD